MALSRFLRALLLPVVLLSARAQALPPQPEGWLAIFWDTTEPTVAAASRGAARKPAPGEPVLDLRQGFKLLLRAQVSWQGFPFNAAFRFGRHSNRLSSIAFSLERPTPARSRRLLKTLQRLYGPGSPSTDGASGKRVFWRIGWDDILFENVPAPGTSLSPPGTRITFRPVQPLAVSNPAPRHLTPACSGLAALAADARR